TGAFISGSYSNGFLWSGNYQGLIGLHAALAIPEIALTFGVDIPIHIPINIDAGVVTLQGFSIVAAENNIDFTPIIIPTINITLPTAAITVGGPTTSIGITASAGIGSITIPIIDIPATSGFGNSTTSPSSGFFNSGAGSASGFLNVVAGASGISGYLNVGALGSGVTNVGHTVSGFYNASALDLVTPAFASGLMRDGMGTMTLNLGLANLGSNNAGFGNTGIFDVGVANLGNYNIGFGN
ncbi:hypothetical protein IU13_21810, partial [Mycobacterium tuberculosis]